jgi:tetratricopeptide (TPR) repeat protein
MKKNEILPLFQNQAQAFLVHHKEKFSHEWETLDKASKMRLKGAFVVALIVLFFLWTARPKEPLIRVLRYQPHHTRLMVCFGEIGQSSQVWDSLLPQLRKKDYFPGMNVVVIPVANAVPEKESPFSFATQILRERLKTPYKKLPLFKGAPKEESLGTSHSEIVFMTYGWGRRILKNFIATASPEERLRYTMGFAIGQEDAYEAFKAHSEYQGWLVSESQWKELQVPESLQIEDFPLQVVPLRPEERFSFKQISFLSSTLLNLQESLEKGRQGHELQRSSEWNQLQERLQTQEKALSQEKLETEAQKKRVAEQEKTLQNEQNAKKALLDRVQELQIKQEEQEKALNLYQKQLKSQEEQVLTLAKTKELLDQHERSLQEKTQELQALESSFKILQSSFLESQKKTQDLQKTSTEQEELLQKAELQYSKQREEIQRQELLLKQKEEALKVAELLSQKALEQQNDWKALQERCLHLEALEKQQREAFEALEKRSDDDQKALKEKEASLNALKALYEEEQKKQGPLQEENLQYLKALKDAETQWGSTQESLAQKEQSLLKAQEQLQQVEQEGIRLRQALEHLQGELKKQSDLASHPIQDEKTLLQLHQYVKQNESLTQEVSDLQNKLKTLTQENRRLNEKSESISEDLRLSQKEQNEAQKQLITAKQELNQLRFEVSQLRSSKHIETGESPVSLTNPTETLVFQEVPEATLLYQEAEKALKETLDPFAAFIGETQMATAKKKFKKILQDYSFSTQAEPAAYQLGVIYAKESATSEEALEYFKKCIAFNPKTTYPVRLALGRLYQAKKNLKEARFWYQEAVEKSVKEAERQEAEKALEPLEEK